MTDYHNGIFRYKDALPAKERENLPLCFSLSTFSNEAILLRLILGTLDIKCQNTNGVVRQRECYTVLPFQKIEFPLQQRLETALGGNASVDLNDFGRYFDKNRKNNSFYQFLLFEFTSYFYNTQNGVSSFIHLYRSLEFISYTFPLIYASRSKEYTKSYNSLKNFFTNGAAELSFFRNFLNAIFDNEIQMINFQFDMPVISNYDINEIENEVKRVLKSVDKRGDKFVFEDGIFSVKFIDLMDFIVSLRNRYVHMALGSWQDNFQPINFNIDDFFKSINPFIMNFLAFICFKITEHGLTHL